MGNYIGCGEVGSEHSSFSELGGQEADGGDQCEQDCETVTTADAQSEELSTAQSQLAAANSMRSPLTLSNPATRSEVLKQKSKILAHEKDNPFPHDSHDSLKPSVSRFSKIYETGR